MKTFAGVLVALAVVAVLAGLLWIRYRLLKGAGVKRSKREFAAREAERDRQAVRVATRSRSVGDRAPRDAYGIADAPQREAGGAPPQSLQNATENRRRAATSTSFDPDLPSS